MTTEATNQSKADKDEAYLNFDIPGVIVVMFLLGLLYARIDSLGMNGRAPPFAAGLLAYAGWKMLNIEQNLFIVVLPLVKVVLVLIAMGMLYRLFHHAPDKRPSVVPSSSAAVP